MAIVMSPQPFRRMARVLHQFEGWRCFWRFPIAGLLRVLPWVIALGGAVGGIYMGADLKFPLVVVGAIIARRLWEYERPDPERATNVLVLPSYLERAEQVLRRNKLSPSGAHTVGTPPPDAPMLTTQITVTEPRAWARSHSNAGRVERIASVLDRADIRARVAGRDVAEATCLERGS